MKRSINHPKHIALLAALFLILPSYKGQAQFQELYENTALITDNYFHTIIKDGQDYYILGSEDGHATITRTNSSGGHLWTRSLSIPSVWADGIIRSGVSGSARLYVVGYTLPFDNTNSSLIGEITPAGTFICLQSLDVPGNESLTGIDEISAGTYSVVGTQTLPSSSQDVIVLNVSFPGCTINSKHIFNSLAQDNFANDIEVLCNGNALVAGEVNGRAVLYQVGSGQFMGGVQNPVQYTYQDVTETSNCDILAVANPTGAGFPKIMRFDASLLPVWEASIFGLTTLHQVAEDVNGNILAVGTTTISGLPRTVVLKINDSSGTPILSWGGAKYFGNQATGYTPGGVTPVLGGPFSGRVAYVDGRTGHPNGFGMTDAFLAITDGDLESACTYSIGLDLILEETLYEGPETEVLPYDFPSSMMESFLSPEWIQNAGCDTTGMADTCCTDSLAFITAAQNVLVFNTLVDCELTYDIEGLTPCMQMLVDWDDHQIVNVVTGNPANISHTYTSSGTYTVCFTIQEINNGEVCWEYEICETVEVMCDTIAFPCGMAVATCFSGIVTTSLGPTMDLISPVIALFDVRDPPGASPGQGVNWPAPKVMFPEGDAMHCGQVFGLAIDQHGSIFTTASTIYGDATNIPGFTWGPGGPGAIYRFTYDAGQGQWVRQLFMTLPNFGSGLGNITYDKNNDQFFVTNHLDGGIYRIPNAPYPVIPPPLSYDFWFHAEPATYPATHPDFADLGIRLWGIGYHPGENRVYYARWNEDLASNRQSAAIQNEIRSIGLLASGGFDLSSDMHEIWLPDYSQPLPNPPAPPPFSSPVSDIEFAENGDMILAEKTMLADIGYATNPSPGGWAHKARVLQYTGSSGNWSIPQHIHIGNTEILPASYNNSAGGVDYGYSGLDANNMVTGCDELIWGSGDALMYPWENHFNTTNTSVVYGIAAMPATGNSNTHWNTSPPWVESSSYYVDLDGNLNSVEKLQIGDVDIFRNPMVCPCPPETDFPCDSLYVYYDPISAPADSLCCYSIDFDHQTGLITEICAHLTTPDWIFNTGALLAGGYIWTQVGTHTLCFSHPGGIPLGSLSDVLTFCLAETAPGAPTPQQITFNWIVGQDTVCRDTIYTECHPETGKDTCVIISEIQADCISGNDLEYCMTFTATNLSNMDAYGLVLGALPAGYAYGDCGCGGNTYGTGGYLFSGFPLIPAHSSQSFCVKIIATQPVLSPTTICFNATLEFAEECCSSTEAWCVELQPCCNPCLNTNVAVHALDSCCYSLDIDYDCDFGFYTHIDFDILTPGVYFGYHTNDLGWNFHNTPTATQVSIEPAVGLMAPGMYSNLFSFCLTDVNMPSEIPQQVLVTFWTLGSMGQDSMACDTLLTLNCEYAKDTCVFVTDEHIECLENGMKYQITVTIQNLSVPNFTAHYLGILGPGITPNPIPLVPPLDNDGSTRTVTFCYTPNPWPDADGKLTLIYRLKSATQDTCCNGNQNFIDTLMLPPCDSCICPASPHLMTLTQNGVDYGVGCRPHGFQDPVIGCPPGDIVISGFYGCIDPVTLEPCSTESIVHYELYGPNGYLYGGNTTNYPSLFIPSADVDENGHYTLILSTLCPGATDSCICILDWDLACDTCCQDLQTFCDRIENNVFILTDPAACKVTLDIGDLFDCDSIREIDWGVPGGYDPGPYGSHQMPMFTYSGSGTYFISYLATETDPTTGFLCLEKRLYDTITIMCDACECGRLVWGEVYGISPLQPIPITCDNAPLPIECRKFGPDFIVHGDLTCLPDSCAGDSVYWTLYRPGLLSDLHGVTPLWAYPHFDIILPWHSFPQAGPYTLEVVRECGTKQCPCRFNFEVAPCPCDCDDLIDDVQDGFTVTGSLASCTRKLNPVSLCPGDQVVWTINGPGVNQVLGPFPGQAAIFPNFPSPGGLYFVCMIVTRIDPVTQDTCIAEHCRTIAVRCLPDLEPAITRCISSAGILNGDFTEGVLEGELGVSGFLDDWNLFPNPGNGHVFIDSTGASDDGQVILSGGKNNFAGIMQRILVDNDTIDLGLMVRHYQGSALPKNSRLEIRLQPEPLPGTESFLTVQIPIDANHANWTAVSVQGSHPVPPGEYYLILCAQNDADSTHSVIGIDNLEFCSDGIVSTLSPVQEEELFIYPNPASDRISLSAPQKPLSDLKIVMVDVHGRILLQEQLAELHDGYEIEVGDLPSGMYFLTLVISSTHHQHLRFIKQ